MLPLLGDVEWSRQDWETLLVTGSWDWSHDTWRKTVVGGEVWVSSSTLELLPSFSPARRLEELQDGGSETLVFILEAFTYSLLISLVWTFTL